MLERFKPLPNPLFMAMWNRVKDLYIVPLPSEGAATPAEEEAAIPWVIPHQLENYDGAIAFDLETKAPYSPYDAGAL